MMLYCEMEKNVPGSFLESEGCKEQIDEYHYLLIAPRS
jgi:hypothetical protein